MEFLSLNRPENIPLVFQIRLGCLQLSHDSASATWENIPLVFPRNNFFPSCFHTSHSRYEHLGLHTHVIRGDTCTWGDSSHNNGNSDKL